MKLVPPQRKPFSSQSGPVARDVGLRHAFSYLRPSGIAVLGLLIVVSTAVAGQRLHSSFTTNAAEALATLGLEAPATEEEEAATASTDSDEAAGQESSTMQGNSSAIEDAADSSNRTSIVIESSSTTTTNGETTTSQPKVIINGTPVELPANGTIRQDERDDNTRTQIRARVKTDGASINISTKSSIKSEAD